MRLCEDWGLEDWGLKDSFVAFFDNPAAAALLRRTTVFPLSGRGFGNFKKNRETMFSIPPRQGE